ncbi:MAG: hypothetical protein H7320_12170 [Ferruginibacter sp.]|nr:hypothetical protein [Ferruginibacter sp.]
MTDFFKGIFILLANLFFSLQLSAQKIKPANFSFSYSTTPEQVGFSSERLARLDSLLNNFIATGTMPNAVTFIGIYV